jgi:hypothetical protein
MEVCVTEMYSLNKKRTRATAVLILPMEARQERDEESRKNDL